MKMDKRILLAYLIKVSPGPPSVSLRGRVLPAQKESHLPQASTQSLPLLSIESKAVVLNLWIETPLGHLRPPVTHSEL